MSEPTPSAADSSPNPPVDGPVRTAHAPGPRAVPTKGSDGFDPYAKMFDADGQLDQEYVRKRVPTLVDLLREHAGCYSLRVDHEQLAAHLLKDDAAALRSADDQEAFERALSAFSRKHLHEVLDDDIVDRARTVFGNLTRDVDLSRRGRVAAAIGLTFLSGVPDQHGQVGRPLFDLMFRVSLEELHAQERLRLLAAETEGGLPPEDLEKFWTTYPALRYAYEQRYRREVTRVLQEIEEGNFPLGISVDLALRGIHQLQTAALAAQESGATFDQAAAQNHLREPFADDMLDGGSEEVIDRWQRAADSVKGPADARRAYVRAVSSAIRLVVDGGPGGDAVLFYAYLHAIVEGQFHIEEPEEADVARGVFNDVGLTPDGVLAYVKYQESKDRLEAAHRLASAALATWPEHEGVVALASVLADAQMVAAAEGRQGPTYEEKDSEDDADAPDDASPADSASEEE